MNASLTREEELIQDIDNITFSIKYYIGVLAELECLGKTHSQQFRVCEKNLAILRNNKKRLEEMAMLICKSKNPHIEKDCSECVFDCMCDIQDGCEVLINAGYRKSFDVAREIFEEIENNSYSYGVNFVISKETLAELKKKYTEEKNDTYT